MSDTPIWERQPHDTDKSFAAFCIYRDMGSKRSLDKAYTAYKRGIFRVQKGDKVLEAPTFFTNWSVEHYWQVRIVAWDTNQDSLRQQRNLKRQKLIEDNAYQDYSVIRKAIEKYKNDYIAVEFRGIPPSDISNLISLMKQADDYARRAVGLPDRITENKNEITGKDGGAIIFKSGQSLDDL